VPQTGLQLILYSESLPCWLVLAHTAFLLICLFCLISCLSHGGITNLCEPVRTISQLILWFLTYDCSSIPASYPFSPFALCTWPNFYYITVPSYLRHMLTCTSSVQTAPLTLCRIGCYIQHINPYLVLRPLSRLYPRKHWGEHSDLYQSYWFAYILYSVV